MEILQPNNSRLELIKLNEILEAIRLSYNSLVNTIVIHFLKTEEEPEVTVNTDKEINATTQADTTTPAPTSSGTAA